MPDLLTPATAVAACGAGVTAGVRAAIGAGAAAGMLGTAMAVLCTRLGTAEVAAVGEEPGAAAEVEAVVVVAAAVGLCIRAFLTGAVVTVGEAGEAVCAIATAGSASSESAMSVERRIMGGASPLGGQVAFI